MTDDEIVRVRYFDRQFLQRQDFSDEQEYHVAMRRRHAIAGHSWGIVRGLTLTPAERQVFVEPGLAVDGYGREVLLAQRLVVAPPPGDVSYHVWIEYDRVGTEQRPEVGGSCGPGAAGEPDYYRWQERPRLRVVEATDPPDPRNPPEVPPAERDFGPERTPPEEEHHWPVYLGRVRPDPDRPELPFVVDVAGRPYAGLVGAKLAAPSGAASIRFGSVSKPGAGPAVQSEVGEFAVLAADSTDPTGEGKPLLLISGDGTAVLETALAVHGELSIADALEFPTDPEPTAPDADPPRPWSLYRSPGSTGKQELRIEIPGDEGRFVVGSRSVEDGKFKPALTVDADGTVTVHGTLQIQGELDDQSGTFDRTLLVDGGLDPEADRLVTAAVMGGITGASGLANRLYRSPTADQASATTEVAASAATLRAAELPPALVPGLASVLADTLATDAGLAAELAEQLRTRHPSAARTLRGQLVDPDADAPDPDRPPAEPTGG